MKIILNLENNIIDPTRGMVKGLKIASSMMGREITDDKFFLPFLEKGIVKTAMEIFNMKEIEARAFNKWYVDFYNRVGKKETDIYHGIGEFLEKLYKDNDLYVISNLLNLHVGQILKMQNLEKYFKGYQGINLNKSPQNKFEVLTSLIYELSKEEENQKIIIISGDGEDINLSSELNLIGIFTGEADKTCSYMYKAEELSEIEEILEKIKNEWVWRKKKFSWKRVKKKIKF